MISVVAPVRVDESSSAGQGVQESSEVVVQGGEAAQDELQRLRAELERLDGTLIDLLSARQQLAVAVGRAKRVSGLPVVDPAQEAVVLRRAGERARAAGLAEEDIRRIFWCIIDLSRDAQRAALDR